MDTQNEKSNDENFESIYCRFRCSGKRLLDAFGLKAWRLRVKRRKGGGQ